MPTGFLASLLNSGVNAGDAQALEKYFDHEPEFLAGLETIARAIGINEPLGLFPPAGEPWRTLHAAMLHAADMQQAFIAALTQYPPDIQIAITGAITTRANQVQQFQQSFQTGSSKRKKPTDYIRWLNSENYSFKYNMCTGAIELNEDCLLKDVDKPPRYYVMRTK